MRTGYVGQIREEITKRRDGDKVYRKDEARLRLLLLLMGIVGKFLTLVLAETPHSHVLRTN